MIQFWQNRLSHRLSLLTLLLVGFFLRVHRLGDKRVWWDEGLAAWTARDTLAATAHWTAHDVHPPLYFWLLHFWRLAGGDSEFGLRLLSVMIGVLTVAAAYLLGRLVGGRKVGLLSALLMTISRFDIAWSQEMRMYALSALLGALALWAAIRVWNRGRWRDWLAYILFMTAGLYTLYLSVSVLVVVNLIWLFGALPRAAQKWREFWRWSAGQAVILALFAPWLAYALPRIPTWSSAEPVAPLDFVKIYWTMLTVGVPLNVGQYARFTLPVLAIFVGGTAVILWGRNTELHREKEKEIENPRSSASIRVPKRARNVWLLVIGLLFPAVVVYAVSIPKETFFYAPPVAPRYLIIFLAAYTTLMAWGLVELGRKRGWISWLLTAVVLYTAWVGLRDYHAGRILLDDYKSLALTLEAYRRPSDAVILFTDTDWPIFAYHYPDEWRGVPHAWQITPQAAGDFLSPIWEASDGVWLVVTPYAGVSDPQGAMMAWLAQRATAVTDFPYEDKTLYFYARADEPLALQPGAEPRWSKTAVLPHNRQLTGYDQVLRDARSGDTVHLFLYGRGAAAETGVGLVDEAGAVWQETAVTLTQPRQQVDVLISPDTPDGRYHLFVRDEAGNPIRLGPIALHQKGGVPLAAADVTIANRLDVDFAAGIRLLGYEVETEAPQPGGTVYLTLYWQVQEPVTQKYKIFTHLLGDVYNADTENFLWGQQDNEPVNNTRPTTTWRSGEVIVDSYAIPIAPHAPPGAYQIEIGLYDPVTGSRLLTLAGEDHLVVTAVDIR